MTVTEPTTTPEDLDGTDAIADDPAEDAVVEEDVLVEEISIDGMCGVY